MAQVPEKVLAWLYSVLQEYHDAPRTYSDAARTLAALPSLSPRTEVYTYEDGSSALLLTLSGTLPVDFRGTTYRFPLKLWMPQSYPQDAPIAYVMPGRDMLVRPGQHVGVDGRIYHPYLRDWQRTWDRASIGQFLDHLQQVFAKEPPVISKAQQQQYHQRPIGQSTQPQTAPGADLPPHLPPKQRAGSIEPVEMPGSNAPPPRPPKPGEEPANPYQQRTASRDPGANGPPLPPLPHERVRPQQYVPSPQHQNGYAASPRPASQVGPPQQALGYQNGRPPELALPPGSQHYQQHERARSSYDRSPVSPVSPVPAYAQPAENRYSQAPPLPQQMPPHHQHPRHHPHHPQIAAQSGPHPQPAQQYQPQQPAQPHHQPPSRAYPPAQHHLAPPPLKQPPPDLLSDPFDLSSPNPATSAPPGPAPPIPPNPEREHLLHALSTTLTQQAQQKVHQNLAALAPLQAQHLALRDAHARLASEVRGLESLAQTLASNEAILHRSLADCDRVVHAAKTKPPPNVDEVLVPTTLVAQQLWACVAEEAAAREAMYVLQRAVDKGRVGGEDFVRQMRGLGREVFGKMVLARKCARGLGLEVGPRGRGGG
ncbi:suppressor protein stp22 of temperature-sensitive alpha-factor receptor and arginine permease [Teratosphaeriaceae sp. CCFEE 6253]|nr:suppressor protein stp22 of temperature-sensitive alpha-factor receptor and arginine permease [Teratosphaeriaceae sp. CCFEE 6253]